MRKDFSESLKDKKIPILTLDNKWYHLLSKEMRKSLSSTENKLNQLLRRQGKLNTEKKELKKIKKKLMNEIVSMADEADDNKEVEKKMELHKKLLNDCNERLDKNRDDLLQIPFDIDHMNYELMLETMDNCYQELHDNEEKIEQIANWVKETRIELKKQLIRKQEMEQKNHQIYSYMHDIFGAEVLDLFDLQYNPDEHHPILPEEK